jgi:hypothetical protein
MKLLITSFVFAVALFVFPAGSHAAVDKKLEETVRAHLQEKIQLTSTLDIFDSKVSKVRNLRLLEFLPDVNNEKETQIVKMNFRDIVSGDVVVVSAHVKDAKVVELKIEEVKALEKKEVDPNKVFTKTDVEPVIKEYVEKKSKFTKTFDLFDEKKQAFRHLEFVQFDGDLRNFGILYILRVDFKDAESQQTLKVDFTVENNKGALSVKSVKVFEIKK